MDKYTHLESDVNYSCFRVIQDDLPTGLTIRAETMDDALRKLALASDRTDLSESNVHLQLTS